MKLSAKCHTRNNSPIPILRTREVFIYIFVYLENNSSINHIMSRYATSEMEENIFLILKSNTLQSLVAIENQSLEIQMYTYFIVAKRYTCCR